MWRWGLSDAKRHVSHARDHGPTTCHGCCDSSPAITTPTPQLTPHLQALFFQEEPLHIVRGQGCELFDPEVCRSWEPGGGMDGRCRLSGWCAGKAAVWPTHLFAHCFPPFPPAVLQGNCYLDW